MNRLDNDDFFPSSPWDTHQGKYAPHLFKGRDHDHKKTHLRRYTLQLEDFLPETGLMSLTIALEIVLDSKLEFANVTRASCGNPRLHIDFREE